MALQSLGSEVWRCAEYQNKKTRLRCAGGVLCALLPLPHIMAAETKKSGHGEEAADDPSHRGPRAHLG